MEEALIEEVRCYPCLRKTDERSHKDKVARENAWKEVAKKVNLTVEEVPKKWKNMRDKFVKEHKKVKEVKSGDPGPPYKPSWKLYELLLFLKDSIRHQPTSSNFPPEATEELVPTPNTSTSI
jgi:hypothetical protein